MNDRDDARSGRRAVGFAPVRVEHLRLTAALLALGGAFGMVSTVTSCARADEGTIVLGGPADDGISSGADASVPGFDEGLDADPTKCREANGVDDDGDGYTEAEGDCDDCRRSRNPGAFDYPGNGIDEDCSGRADDEVLDCDVGAPIDSNDPLAAVRALGLCRSTTEDARGAQKTWGVISARYVKPDGTPETDPLSHGISPTFGVNKPQEGASMLVLSTGTARAPGMPGYRSISGYDKGYGSGAPAGYPKESPACPGITTGRPRDGAGLEIVVRVPTNVRSLHVDQNFFTLEFPGYVCTNFNDFFVIDMEPRVPSYPDGNIAFDSAGNPISVNNALLQVCEPRRIGGRDYTCPLGTGSLAGTGFDVVGDESSPAPHAATKWLTTSAPVSGGQTVRLRFTIWDSSDGMLDSTVLVDRFGWSELENAGTEPSAGPN